MRIVRDQITLAELTELAAEQFGDLVKAVVDTEREIMAVGAGMHADEEQELLRDGSRQEVLWGINLYVAEYGTPAWLEYDSMINLRPRLGNRTRSIEHPEIRAQVAAVVERLVTR